jgi:hypothetical protein
VGSCAGRRAYTNRCIHHHLVGLDWLRTAIPIDRDAIWHAARPLQIEATETLQLSTDDTLIHLCLHPAIQHGYAWPLIGMVDIDRVLARAGDVFCWDRLIQAIEELKPIAGAIKNALLQARLKDYDALLHEDWTNKKPVASQISDPHIDTLCDEAWRHGAQGG